jgi:signal transduction histidine kinase
VVIGSLGAVVMAVGVGHEGYIALFWLGLGPIIGLVISGPRLAGWLLLPAAGLAALAILLIVNEVVRPFIRVDHLAGPHIVSLLGAIFSYFLLVLSFERETARTIAELARSIDEGRQARALAERAAQARGEFLAMMGHEVRTPLNGVLGIVSVMLAEHMPPQVEEGLRTIESSGAVLRALLDDVLDYSRYESGQYELESRPLELAQVGRDVIELMRGIALVRGDRLELEVASGTPAWVVGDETRLRQVMNNLISNAVKFTEGGLVRVQLSGIEGGFRLVVSDDGLGMNPQTVERLFRPFMQADETTTRRFGGSGLGLAIVHLLVQRMKGTVSVESEPGRGSRFKVEIPWAACAPPASVVEPVELQSQSARVLVVEDNLINQRVVRRLLEQLGHVVTCAGDGIAALECLQRAQFDLVLMDCHMPVMDGFTATERIRLNPQNPPVVAVTASTTREDHERCKASGMLEVLNKPIRREDLSRVIAQFVKRT